MLKIIIADDEERICQLIQALVDWNSLNMEVVGIAHNGVEAFELVKLHQPHILITDIRMPGCNGLDLIENVKKVDPALEIIVISGYAHFEYAQTAIRFGVGDYLLKPVSKTELNSTLKKLKEKVISRQDAENRTNRLLQRNQKDIHRLQKTLIEHLIEKKAEELTFDILRSEYGLQVEEGLFQVFWIKVDEYMDKLGESGVVIVMEKILNLVESSLKPKCLEFLAGYHRSSCVGIMNYDGKKQEEIRRILRDCLNQLESGRGIFGPVSFSMALGSVSKDPGDLNRLFREVSVMIQERLVKGAGRIQERMPDRSSIQDQNLLEKYLRNIKHAIEIMSAEEADRVVEQMQTIIEQTRDAHGYEIYDLISSCGSLFLSQVEVEKRTEIERDFKQRCEQCSNLNSLFRQLADVQRKYIDELRQKREGEEERPIRLAKQYIQKHYHEQITLEEVSKEVGLSTAYFSVQFKKAEGEGFAKYLINIRMEQAKILLRETNYSVSEICKRVGYNDLKHFTHTFEKAAGVKPVVYRKLYG